MAKSVEKSESQSASFKKTVERSNAYPAHSMEYAFELTKKIYLQFGASSHNTRETIGKILKMSAAYLAIPLSTATQYGLLEMKSKVGYNPTPLFLRYYKPESEGEKREAQLECLKNPKLYELLFAAYKGNKLPSSEALATVLFRRYNIAENASTKAAEIFIENLKTLSLLNEENVLIDFDSVSTTDEQPEPKLKTAISEPIALHPQASSSQSQQAVMQLGDLSMAIKLSEGKRATLIYPENISDADWDKIVRVIGAMKED